MPQIDFTITGEQFFYIIIMTLIFGYIVNRIISFVKKFDANILQMEVGSIIEKCYELFPIETFSFKGKVFKRGMKVEMVTEDKKKYEGEIIGANNANVICIITSRCIITREINSIVTIQNLEELFKGDA